MAKRKGYGRVSSKGQAQNGNSLEDQRRKLEEAGCAEEDIVLETYTGTKMDRPKFGKLIESLEAGDTLVVCKLDRFARTAGEGSELVKSLLERGVNVHILNMGLIENTPTGRLILNVLLSFAEFERDMIVERTSEGKAVARATNPDFKEGRPRKEIPGKFFELLESDVSVADACKTLGIHRTQWYRWKNEIS
ncbi:recombinase family protein [Succinimonas sp.]|uniref:recombinase family protein n=1 Tax=Succinimonas sp. TaxID=1936151 RepID=UPI00386DC6FC